CGDRRYVCHAHPERLPDRYPARSGHHGCSCARRLILQRSLRSAPWISRMGQRTLPRGDRFRPRAYTLPRHLDCHRGTAGQVARTHGYVERKMAERYNLKVSPGENALLDEVSLMLFPGVVSRLWSAPPWGTQPAHGNEPSQAHGGGPPGGLAA